MSFTQAIAAGFFKYFNFSGRSARSEFWYWVLFTMLAGIVVAAIDYALGLDREPLSTIFGLATMIPNLAVMVRRLHDTDHRGWWLLVGLLPLVGVVVLIVWFCFDGTPGYNRFGPNPFGSGGHIAGPLTDADRVREEAWRRRTAR